MRNSPSMLHRWEIQLEQLDEQELRSLENFFSSNNGAAGIFSFSDPTTQLVYPNCSLVDDSMDLTYLGELSSRTLLRIQENRS